MAARGPRFGRWVDRVNIPLATGAVILQSDQVGVVLGSYTCNRMSIAQGMRSVGFAMAPASQPAGDTAVQIELPQLVYVEYYANAADAGAIVLATDFFAAVRFLDEGTVTKSVDNGLTAGALITYGFAGLVYDLTARDGVGIVLLSNTEAKLLADHASLAAAVADAITAHP